ncbi:MAG: PTS sugar transporter subunit IIA [Deltaproteobacteria bacterium]|nr:PTS sugar transporter subunit IIA [Deltaproteobacteria bacterium]
MNIREMLCEECVADDIKSRTKREVLVELSEIFNKSKIEIDADLMVEVLLEREKLGSTGIGGGIAIPHGKMAGLDRLILSFGRSKSGVEFDALDGKPVYIFFMLMAPDNSAGQHLKALAKISKMLKDEEFRKKLMGSDSAKDIYNLIIEQDKAFL